MKTLYIQTSHLVPRAGNVVDLGEFRRRQALARRDSLAPQPEGEPLIPEEASGFRPEVLTMSRAERRSARRERRSWTLDVCASLAVVLMTLVFTLRILL